MVPVMLTKVVVHGERYKPHEYLMVVLITAGIVMYQFKSGGESKV